MAPILRRLFVTLAFLALLPVPTRVDAQTAATKVVILGTGTPIADPSRSGPAVAVVVGYEVYLIDAGPGIVRRASAAAQLGIVALDPSNLTRLFITHLHSDHTLGLPDLMFTPWQNGRLAPLEVWGPPGIQSMTANIEAAWVEDIKIRTLGPEHMSRPDFRAVAHEIEAGEIYDDGTVWIDAIPVDHLTWPFAFGYRFRTPDRTIVMSGDTCPSAALLEACNRCDVLVHEVYSRTFIDGHQNPDYHLQAHTSTAELAKLAAKAQPGLLVLYHQLHGWASDEDLVKEVREAGYKGKVVSARDLDVF
jgi:ribonuclease BN (tRNA processing enzyme)